MDVMSQPDEMQELLGYLKNIRSYERDHIKSERSTIVMMWGLFITIGGLLDIYASLLADYSPHGGVWFVVIAAAILTQQILSTQPLLYDEKFTDELQRDNVPLSEVILIIIIMALTYPIGFYNTALVMPYIGLSFGLVNLVNLIKSEKISIKSTIPTISFFLAGFLGLFVYLIDPSNSIFSGLIFGLVVGISTFYTGYLGRKELIVE